jgi:hypothetical protein
MFDRGEQRLDQPFLVACADVGRRRRVHPLRVDLRTA